MDLTELIWLVQQIFTPYVPFWAVVFVVACFIFGIFFAMVIMILRRV
jgi:hypothetical protein